MRSKIITALLFVLTVAALGTHSSAQNNDKNKGKELKAAVDRVDKASDVIDEVMKLAEKSIPRDLLKKAKAIVVFPGTLKAAFIVGGQGGTGRCDPAHRKWMERSGISKYGRRQLRRSDRRAEDRLCFADYE